MVHIYVTCGEWKSCKEKGWTFVVDEGKGGKLLVLESTTTFEELKSMLTEDYGFEKSCVKIDCSYLPADLINNVGTPPVIISNDRQTKNCIGYVKKKSSVQLCVTFKPLDEEPKKSVDLSRGKEKVEGGRTLQRKAHDVEIHVHSEPISDDLKSKDEDYSSHKKIQYSPENIVEKSQRFESKQILKAKLEIHAMKHNFDYRVTKSTSKWWSIRCTNTLCNWMVRAKRLHGYDYVVITKYVATHTCAPSSKTKSGKTASTKTIGRLIMNKYACVKEGPKPHEVIEIMRTDHGVELNYSLAWEAREYAINAIRGIPEKSYAKIPKYLYMLKSANPGTHYAYETDEDDRFKYLFIAFGQSIRGFHKAIRRVIVVDGTFLKNKYKGVLLVATALDGNSNLYPIAFGVVDSENDLSWEWFLIQLRVVIADDHGLAFISDRYSSIVKGLEKVYPQSRHGICIHHLLSNVVKKYHGKDMAGFVSEASKVYRHEEFKEKFTAICSFSPTIGKYLIEADVRKWARCLFPGQRFDIRTTNPAESLNSALRVPREYPIIPLLDSIKEMLTRWFHERKTWSSKHNQPLTVEVEKKVARRIEKGKTFSVYPINEHRFHVRGDRIECLVDLDERICTCGKYDLQQIPCRHAIKAGLSVGRDTQSLTDEKHKTLAWREVYDECINPIVVPEDAWRLPPNVEESPIFPHESRRAAGRRRKRRYESVEDKIRSSSKGSKRQKRTHKCSRCFQEGHNRTRCDMVI